jgi:molybdate transport system substrate-binding protein
LAVPAVAAAQRNEVHVAVAANFADAQTRLASLFTAGSGHRIVASAGSSGQLYAQVRNGAPFDIFLSADTVRTAQLERDSLTVPRSRFVYAVGRLVLYGPGLDSVRSGGADLRDGQPTALAIANPVTAPYGAAAVQVLVRMGRLQALEGRLVRGESIAQAFQFVESRAAPLGFVALSQVRDKAAHTYWLVPAEYHDPIAQEAVLLRRGQSNPAALAYVAFLKGDVARRVIESFGYGTR